MTALGCQRWKARKASYRALGEGFDSVQWSPWRTYDHPSGTRRTLPH